MKIGATMLDIMFMSSALFSLSSILLHGQHIGDQSEQEMEQRNRKKPLFIVFLIHFNLILLESLLFWLPILSVMRIVHGLVKDILHGHSQVLNEQLQGEGKLETL